MVVIMTVEVERITGTRGAARTGGFDCGGRGMTRAAETVSWGGQQRASQRGGEDGCCGEELEQAEREQRADRSKETRRLREKRSRRDQGSRRQPTWGMVRGEGEVEGVICYQEGQRSGGLAGKNGEVQPGKEAPAPETAPRRDDRSDLRAEEA
jgi:hypothetical protein